MFSVRFSVRGIALPKQGDWPHWAPSLEATPHISASSRHSPEPCLGAPVLHLCTFILCIDQQNVSSGPCCLGLWRRLPRSALLSDGGETRTRHCRGDLPFPFSRPLSQVTILLLATLWFILPLTHVLISPYFISMPLHSVEQLDMVLIVCLKVPP